MEQAILEQIGLTRSEINVYLSLLELGSSSTGKIVNKSKASSSKIYEILDRLMQKGLVSFIIKSGVKYFEAASPERIMDYMKEKEEKFSEQKQELRKIIPELKLKRTLSKYKSEATIYKGIKGVETAFYSLLNLLKKGDEQLVIGMPIRTEALNRFFVKFQKEKAKRKIKTRFLVNEDARNEIRVQQENAPFTKIKFIPKDTPAAVNIFNDKVIIFPEAEEILLIVIDSKEVADAFRVQFEMWWNQDVNVYKGFDNVTGKFDSMLDYMEEGDEYLVLGATHGKGGEKLGDWFMNYHTKRVKKGIKVRLLTIPEAYQQVQIQLTSTGDPEMKTGRQRRLPAEFSSPMQINLYKGNKVLMFLFGEEMVCFEIESKILYQNFKNYFDALWNQENK